MATVSENAFENSTGIPAARSALALRRVQYTPALESIQPLACLLACF